MTGIWIRRDPALLTLLKILPFAVLHGYTLKGRATLPLFMSVGVSWAFILAHWGFSRAHERCGEFAMALPIQARRLWLQRTGVLAGTSLLVVAGVAALAQAWPRAAGWRSFRPSRVRRWGRRAWWRGPRRSPRERTCGC